MSDLREKQQTHKGAALLLFIMFFMFASVGLTYLLSKSIFADLASYTLIKDSKESYYTAESSVEDVVYRYIKSGLDVDTTETLAIDGATATTTVSQSNEQFTMNGRGDRSSAIRKVNVILNVESGASFNFGVQTGNGGFQMTNSSRVVGNVFSNGAVIGQGSSIVEGNVISASSGAAVDGIHATGTVHADHILNSTIEMDAFYASSFINNSYSGTVFGPGYPLAATATLPFPDDVVDAHKASVTTAIADGAGTHYTSGSSECSGGTWTIDTDTTFSGPTKIDCDVVLKKKGSDTTLTVDDTVWIEGNLDFQSGPSVEANPIQATHTVLFIVDNESDRINSSQIGVGQGTTFTAPTSPKAYIMLVSMNEDAELGGSNTAIDMGQSSNGDVIAYAGHGKITLTNSITLKEVTGYLIDMGNNTTIEYETGLINLNFTSGPGGGFEIGDWREVE